MAAKRYGLTRTGRLALAIACVGAISSLTWLGVSYQWNLSPTLASSIQIPGFPWSGQCSVNNTVEGATTGHQVDDREPPPLGVNEQLSEIPPLPRVGLTHTSIPNGAHVHGYTVFDELYLRDGTLYVVTDEPQSIPDIARILSLPGVINNGTDLSPTGKELIVIDPRRAEELLGTQHIRLNDLTILSYDPEQFMQHYYHWWGEIILGFWRVYSTLSGRGNDHDSLGSLPFPARVILPYVQAQAWRDRPNINGPLMRAAFPGVSIETAVHWQDFLRLNTTVVFERAMFINRYAAHRHPFGSRWYKMISGTMNLTVPDNFWKPVRESLLSNLFGYEALDDMTFPDDVGSPLPVVTYISRQKGGRSLIQKDDDILVLELMDLEDEGLCELQVAEMENMSLKEQIELASRTTIMLGVHGNGLTHQLWMQPSNKSTVIEILIPGGYVYDYEILARNMGHRHYAVWNDTYITYPKGTTHKGIKYPPDFHGRNKIPVHGKTVANLIRQRLMEN